MSYRLESTDQHTVLHYHPRGLEAFGPRGEPRG
jgi:hypothetical protein